jgi:hypothetical protein
MPATTLGIKLMSARFDAYGVTNATDSYHVGLFWERIRDRLIDIHGRASSHSTTSADDSVLRLFRETVFVMTDLVPVMGDGEILSVFPVKAHHMRHQACEEACQIMHLIRAAIGGEWRDVA